MAVRRKTSKFRKGEIIDIEECHDGRYGAPGEKRVEKEKPTPEQMQLVNSLNKARTCRRKMLEYINPGDCYVDWTYEVKNRPPTMKEALDDFQKAIRRVREQYRKRNRELFWFKNIELGTKGGWHIHLVVNEIGDTASILKRAWKKGGTFVTEIRNCEKLYDEDFTKLSNYMTKDEHTVEKKKDGSSSKTRIKEASYSTSRNMPLKKPKVDKLRHWKKYPKAKKGYYIVRIHEGINPVNGYSYRRYTMIKLSSKRNTEVMLR